MTLRTTSACPTAGMLILRRLAMQPHHIRTLRDVVEQHGFAADTVAQTLTDLHRRGLVRNTGYGRWGIDEPGLRLLVDQQRRRQLEVLRADVRDLQRVVELLDRIAGRNAHA